MLAQSLDRAAAIYKARALTSRDPRAQRCYLAAADRAQAAALFLRLAAREQSRMTDAEQLARQAEGA